MAKRRRKTPPASGLKSRGKNTTVQPFPRGDGGVSDDQQLTRIDPRALAQLIRRDRLARGMSWPKYAAFLSVEGKAIGQATVYKIARGSVSRPHETTVNQILNRVRAVPAPATPAAPAETGADREATTEEAGDRAANK